MGAKELTDLVAHGRASGVNLSVLDGVFSWLPLEGTPLEGRACSISDVMRLVPIVGAHSLNALPVKSALSTEELAEHFAALCDRAALESCRVHIEFSPLGGVADLAHAWDIVRLADRPNGGILFDTWHFFRGSGGLELLETLPGDRIMAVQISDADPEVVGSLWNDTLHHRRLPGDGCFELERAIAILDRIGGLNWFGPEVISDDLHALPAAEAVRVATTRLDELLATSRGAP
jgi:sugar phosphate isomerase/epimerase